MNLILLLIPLIVSLVTGLAKNFIKTDSIEDRKVKGGIHDFIPVLTGVLGAFGLCYMEVLKKAP